MAIARAICTCNICGKKFEVKAERRNRADANSFEEWAANNITTCRDCQRAAELQEAQSKAAERNLPALCGSDKQISWAMRIRNRFLDDFDNACQGYPAHYAKFLTDFVNLVLQSKSYAGWWIEFDKICNATVYDLIRAVTNQKDLSPANKSLFDAAYKLAEQHDEAVKNGSAVGL